jgi:hypothetical protein
MPLALLASLIPAAINLVQGIAGKSESDKLADKERQLKLSMPPEMLKAEGMARNLSMMGLPGYEKYREDINQITPNTVSQARQVAQSPSQLIDLMSRSQTATNDALQNLQIRDTQQNIANKQNYQNFLGQKANMTLGIQGANNQTEQSANLQEAQGTKDLFQSLNSAIGSGINTYSTLSMLGYQKDYLKGLQGSWSGGKRYDTGEPLSSIPSGNTAFPQQQTGLDMPNQLSKISNPYPKNVFENEYIPNEEERMMEMLNYFKAQ